MTGIIGAFFGALGFGMMYHLEGKKLLCTALCGALGQLVCVWMRLYTGSPMAPMLAAAFCVTVLAQTLARTLKAPVTVFLVCALIPLVPGKGATKKLKIGFQTPHSACAGQGHLPNAAVRPLRGWKHAASGVGDVAGSGRDRRRLRAGLGRGVPCRRVAEAENVNSVIMACIERKEIPFLPFFCASFVGVRFPGFDQCD